MSSNAAESTLAFIGGGNMAGAIVGGLLRRGRAPASVIVVEPLAEARDRLAAAHPGLRLLPAASAALADATLVVWAVKPQAFAGAARPVAPHVRTAMQLSVMAGIRSDAIAAKTGTDRVVRAMPNTPALIGQGIAALFGRAGADADDRRAAEAALAPTGELLWVGREADLDAVTAVSGSGPAYVFYLIEAMIEAAVGMGLTREQGRRLAIATVGGTAALAAQSSDEPGVLRARVTSKGGTTAAAVAVLDAAGVKATFVAALRAACDRARELGDDAARGR
jgi:pyrroline-5-carboxylate reductase